MYIVMIASDLRHPLDNIFISFPLAPSGSHSFSFLSLPHNLSFHFIFLSLWRKKFQSIEAHHFGTNVILNLFHLSSFVS